MGSSSLSSGVARGVQCVPFAQGFHLNRAAILTVIVKIFASYLYRNLCFFAAFFVFRQGSQNSRFATAPIPDCLALELRLVLLTNLWFHKI